MKTKIILVRHGESQGNAIRQLLGHTNLDLSPLGYIQAEATAKALLSEEVHAVYSSDLLRAYNTAKAHASVRGIDVVSSKNLREIYLGDWEGMLVSDVVLKYGKTYEVDWLENFGTFRFPNGESTLEAGERFYSECEKIANEHPDKTVLIAAHAAVIRSFFAKVVGVAPEKIAETIAFPTNASYSEVYFDGEKFTPGRYSVDDHLAEIGITRFGA